jgi:hypothetical protein
MPCSAIATVRARLVTGLEETVKTIFARREGLTAHATLIDRMLVAGGLGPVWHDVNAGWIDWRMGAGFVRIWADGRVRVSFRDPEKAAQAEAVLRAYGGLLAQAKAKAALAALGQITGEQRLPNGTLVLSVEV